MAKPHGWNWSPFARRQKRRTRVCVAENSSLKWKLPARSSFLALRSNLAEVTGLSHCNCNETCRCLQCLDLANIEAGNWGEVDVPKPTKTAAPRRKYFKEPDSRLYSVAARRAGSYTRRRQEKPDAPPSTLRAICPVLGRHHYLAKRARNRHL